MSTTTVQLRYTGRVRDLSPAVYRWLCERSTSSDPDVRDQVSRIIADVRARGDSALGELAERYDGVSLDSLEVPRSRLVRALDTLDADMRHAMERAARNISHAHIASRPQAFACETEPGIVVGRRPDPLARVGIYAPGGDAAYPSSVLMGALPARAAGVGEIVLCSPPRGREPSPLVLAAAALADVDRVFAVGGAGAIAALAYGTESIPRVDRIVGPGNAYVAEAKLQVTGAVAIDSPAGPSELLVIADEMCDPGRVALEILAQAEHDPRACAVAVVIGEGTARSLTMAIATALAAQPRRDVIARALATNGGVLLAESVREAIAFAADYAPEHLLLVVDDAESALDRVRNAGTVFVGASASVSFGDYMTGANHVLPTGGLARSYSGLSPLDFVRWTTYQR
ncbi:MAG: histidinol dehydrogenase, partial [Gemmatimonadaceae bacterium]